MGELREFEKIDNYMLLKHHNFDGIDQTMLSMTEHDDYIDLLLVVYGYVF